MKVPEFADIPAYHSHVRHGYDLIADTYDRVEAANGVGQRLRRHMQEALFRTFRKGHRVVEIGCGTGIEAHALSARSVDVLATDLSKETAFEMRLGSVRMLPSICSTEMRALTSSD